MNLTHYLAILLHTYTTKNKLQKEALIFFQSIDRILIESSGIDEFKRKIETAIEKINMNNPKCIPIKLYYADGFPNKNDIVVYGFHQVSFIIKAATLTHLSTVEYKSLSNN